MGEKVTEQTPTMFQRSFVGVLCAVIGLSLGISAAHSFGVQVIDVGFWNDMAIAAIASLFSYFLGGNMYSRK